MPHILQKKDLEIHIDLPLENYRFSRFDWTGKIVNVLFQNKPICGFEQQSFQDEHKIGKGFYNEFGIDNALGFEETELGNWFHKIGVGLLRKESPNYHFNHPYTIKPADFEIEKHKDHILITCVGKNINGYTYILKKTISINPDGFNIHYSLQNIGTKPIITDEYVHNFMQLDKNLIDKNYVLNFPFQLKPNHFIETVNTESKVIVGKNNFRFNATPEKDFFFSNLSGNETVEASWKLLNIKNNIGICEKGSFDTNKINLWGWTHVISPELFYKINLLPEQSADWSRTYTLFNIT